VLDAVIPDQAVHDVAAGRRPRSRRRDGPRFAGRSGQRWRSRRCLRTRLLPGWPSNLRSTAD